MPASDPQSQERILVALDPSPQSLAALQAAAQLAAVLHAELHGLFVEDADLLCMCALPFAREISTYSAQPRPLDSLALERQLRTQANRLRQRLAHEAETRQIHWSFQVVRGRVTEELLAAAENALLLSLGRVGQSWQRAMGTTATAVLQRTPRPVMMMGKEGNFRAPLTLIFAATPSGQRALQLALRLAQQYDRELHVFMLASPDESAVLMAEIAQLLTAQGIRGRFTVLPTLAQMEHHLRSQRTGALILSAAEAALVAELQVPVIVVP